MCRVSIRVAIDAGAVLVAVTAAVLLHGIHRNVSVYTQLVYGGLFNPRDHGDMNLQERSS